MNDLPSKRLRSRHPYGGLTKIRSTAWPHTGSPGDPEWYSGGWIFYGPGSSGGSGGGGFQWPTIKWPNFGGGGSGGSIWNKVRRFFGLCYQFREGPAVGDRYHDLAVEASVSARTGNCEWIQIHGVEDVSMDTYLGNTQLGEEWGIDINGFECRGIAFGNEAMSIDFAFGIRHILATYEEINWQMVKCLAENPEIAAVANAALEEFAGSSTCSGVSIEDYVEDRMHSFCASGTDSEDAASALHRDLGREEWITYSQISEETCSTVRCALDVLNGQVAGAPNTSMYCNASSIASGSDIFHVDFTVGPISGTGQTSYDVSTNSVSIIIAESRCEAQTDPLSIYNTILHESLHAQMGLALMEKGLDPYEINSYTDSELWDAYIINYYIDNAENVTPEMIQHAILVFTEEVVGKLSTELWIINGNRGTPEHYHLLAWNGLIRYAQSYSQDVVGPGNYFVDLDQYRQNNLQYNSPCD